MSKLPQAPGEENGGGRIADLPPNVWAASLGSFFMDVSSEMVLNVLPFFLANVLGVRTVAIGLIEGVAEATASVLKWVSGRLSDRLRRRKWLAVGGYALSALTRPFFAIAGTWPEIAAARWVDRVGKGIRTAPRDALVADSTSPGQRGLAFGFHRAADTAGAVVGLGLALAVVGLTQAVGVQLDAAAFRQVAIVSLVPAVLCVVCLAVGIEEVAPRRPAPDPPGTRRGLGRPFWVFLLIVGVFELGNSSDAFLLLRAQERGTSVVGVLAMLILFNVVYAAVSTPAGRLSDRVGRRRLIVLGWLVYAAVYLGFAVARSSAQVWVLYAAYGVYYALSYGTAKALIADLVPQDARGTAYGAYHAVAGLLDLPASVVAGALWQGVGTWGGFGASAPFFFGAAAALVAAAMMVVWQPPDSQ